MPLCVKAKLFFPLSRRIIGRIVDEASGVEPRSEAILITRILNDSVDYSGFAGVLLEEGIGSIRRSILLPSAFGIIDSSHSLNVGDIVAIDPSGSIQVLYRRRSFHNSLYVTGRCNSRCIMCSQPPIEHDEFGLLEENLRIIELADKSTRTLGITGGEPTLSMDDLLKIIEHRNYHLPQTSLHLLSNGRLLRNDLYAKRLATIGGSTLTVAVPLYSDIDYEHDYIVQANNSFCQAVEGILNLARYKVPIEVRIVIHRLNYSRLPQLAEFIYRNLTFARHIALMALEPIGLASNNISLLWIDPVEYSSQLREATLYLAKRSMSVSIYNHQLCTVDEDVRGFCNKSISDWKVAYLIACNNCSFRSSCGGFFSSSLSSGYYSKSIRPF